MDRKLIKILSCITEEEQHILNGDHVRKEQYTSDREFIVDNSHLLEKGELIRIRTHTRFIDFPLHGHNYIEMMYVCQGKITHTINGCEVVMNEGDVIMLNKKTKHAVKAAGVDDIGVNFVILPEFFDTAINMLEKSNIVADFLVGFLKKDGSKGQYLHFELKDDLRVNNLIENLIYSLIYKQNNENVINKTTMGLLFMCLVKNIKALRQDAANNYEDIMMRSVLRYIDHYYKSARLTELAESMNQSISSLSRFIKIQTGHTFKELLQRKRFQVALELLYDTSLPINDIVIAVGYENNSYFHRRFLEKYKMSPGEYRKNKNKDSLIHL